MRAVRRAPSGVGEWQRSDVEGAAVRVQAGSAKPLAYCRWVQLTWLFLLGCACLGKGAPQAVNAGATVDEGGERWAIQLVKCHPSMLLPCTVALGGVRLEGATRPRC